MHIFNVSPLPFKEIIKDLSAEMNAPIHESLGEYVVEIPKSYGEGKISGVNFPNGVGFIQYRCNFKKETAIRYKGNHVHPLKFLYCAEHPVEHKFLNTNESNVLDTKAYHIAASARENGHELLFQAGADVHLVSVEINRSKFLELIDYDLAKIDASFYSLIGDVNAVQQFHHSGYYNLLISKCIEEIDNFKGKKFTRINYLGAKSLEMFSYLLEQYHNELIDNTVQHLNVKIIADAEDYIKHNLHAKISIKEIAKEAGTNPVDLQRYFKLKHDCTVNQYITNLRLSKAVKLLDSTNYPVSEVAEAVGFQSRSHFTLIFKNKYGITPKKYAKSK